MGLIGLTGLIELTEIKRKIAMTKLLIDDLMVGAACSRDFK